MAINIASTQNQLTTQDIASICGGQVQTAVMNGVQTVTESCNQPEDEPTPPTGTVTVPASEGTVGFDYPLGWSVMITGDKLNDTWNVQATEGYFNTCAACEGNATEVRMYRSPKASNQDFVAAGSIETYLTNNYLEYPNYSNVTMTAATLGEGILYKLTGSARPSPALSGPFEILIFESPNYLTEIVFNDSDTTQTDNEAWQIIKDSLDFSGIN